MCPPGRFVKTLTPTTAQEDSGSREGSHPSMLCGQRHRPRLNPSLPHSQAGAPLIPGPAPPPQSTRQRPPCFPGHGGQKGHRLPTKADSIGFAGETGQLPGLMKEYTEHPLALPRAGNAVVARLASCGWRPAEPLTEAQPNVLLWAEQDWILEAVWGNPGPGSSGAGLASGHRLCL